MFVCMHMETPPPLRGLANACRRESCAKPDCVCLQAETMDVWKKKLGNIQGLIELVNTSQLADQDIRAIVDFIQVP
jgi:hypothetical protein